MSLDELQAWILSADGLLDDVRQLARMSASRSIGGLSEVEPEVAEYQPNWPRLLLAGSVLSTSNSPQANESALAIAQAGLLLSEDQRVVEASATILTQLANHRAIKLAVDKNRLRGDFVERVGISEQLLLARRELEQAVVPVSGDPFSTNRFQQDFWDNLNQAMWISASSPTASGKTYLVLRWLLNEFARRQSNLAIFLAPTRALVGEIERSLLELAASHRITDLRVASLPLAALGDNSRPTILVFTQERLHVFLNATEAKPTVDVMMVDEVHKIGDGLRGVILQDAVERVVRGNPTSRLVFLSPLTENPETLIEDAPIGRKTAVLPSTTVTVTQNLIVAAQLPRRSNLWQLSLVHDGVSSLLGTITLHARPDSATKRLSYLALAIGRTQTGTLIYANGAAAAEKIASQIFEGLGDLDRDVDQELIDLSEFARKTVHPDFQLVELVRRGVAFHYGNMPTLLRCEIERLFKEGKLAFLVCTSTLVEGVNLACRTIVLRGPQKGRGKPMRPHDFWNLAGRAGRWGYDFSGNIVCVDVDREKLWPDGAPKRTKYPIRRETDSVLAQQQLMLEYLDKRAQLTASSLDASLEQVAAYLLAWHAREGTFRSAPSAARLSEEYVDALDRRLGILLEKVDLPDETISRHPGVSAVALQSLLSYFRVRKKPVDDLLPSSPESSDAFNRLVAVFHRINKHLVQAFPRPAVPVYALVTVEWMRGLPLGQIINRRIKYLSEKDKPINTSAVIRQTMQDVEEVARFRAPKYLAAYLDVLKHHLDDIGQSDLFPKDLRFDLYLEFGVATQTLLSLIGIGLSRTSAVAINDFLGSDVLTEGDVLRWLRTRRWETLDIPAVVRREVNDLLSRRDNIAA